MEELKEDLGDFSLEQEKFIVEFNEPPLSEIYLESKKAGTYSKELMNQRKSFIDARSREVDSFLKQKKGQVLLTFYNVFSGAAVLADTESLDYLVNQGMIKRYSRDGNFELSLVDSAQLIGADDVWRLNSSGQLCSGAPPIINNKPSDATSPPPNDDSLFQQEGLTQMPGGESQGSDCVTGKGIVISIIDTGVDYTHPDLGNCTRLQFLNGECSKVIGGYDFANNDNDPMDINGHGTNVASIAAGKGTLASGQKIYGIAPDAKLLAYKLTNGSLGIPTYSATIAALDRSVDPNSDGDYSDRADIISMSFNGIANSDPDQFPTSISINNAVDLGVVVVVPAGGIFLVPGCSIIYPGNMKKVITVGMIDKNLYVSPVSCKGPVFWRSGQTAEFFSLVKPDITAPGISICAAGNALGNPSCFDDKHVLASGSSMAVPHIAGVVALMLQRNPSLTPAKIKTILKHTAHSPLVEPPIIHHGRGIVDASAAVFFNYPIAVGLEPIKQEVRYFNFSGNIEPFQEEFEVRYELSVNPNPNITLSQSGNGWIKIYEGVTTGGQFSVIFDSSILLEGTYLVRLRAYDILGRTFDDYGYFTVEKYKLIKPLSNDRLNPKSANYIIVSNIYNFDIDFFDVQYSFNNGPFTREGIEIVHSEGPELIARLEANTISEEGFADFLIRIRSDGGEKVYNAESVYFDPSLKVGWPISIDHYKYLRDNYTLNYLWSSHFDGPYQGDFNGDGNDDLALIQPFVGIKIFSIDGTPMSTIAFNYPNFYIPFSLVADINSDGKDEIFVQTNRSSPAATLWAYNMDGTAVEGWDPFEIPLTGSESVQFVPISKDLDQDGSPEVVLKAYFRNSSNRKHEGIFIVSAEGNIEHSWITEQKGGELESFGTYPVVMPSDGSYFDIVVASTRISSGVRNNGALAVYDMKGSLKWKRDLRGYVLSSPVVADIDSDGRPEIIVSLIYEGPENPLYGGLYVFDSDGNIKPGWPVLRGTKFAVSPIILDINGDNSLEIVVTRTSPDKRLYVFSSEGTLLWQKISFGSYYGIVSSSLSNEPIIVLPDLWYEWGGGVYAFNSTGGMWRSFPKLTDGITAPPIVDDFDHDGKAELVVFSHNDIYSDGFGTKRRATFYVYELDGIFDELSQYWSHFQFDKQLTGCFKCN